MCGIVGYIDEQGVSKAFLHCLNERQRYRGPDGGDEWIHKTVGLAHRRLAIIDITDAARQPMMNEHENLILVFNGEIYNYKELRALLSAEHRFRSASDGEILLHLYEEKGIAMLDLLEGMFAFALFDQSASRLFLCRDRLGIKPLFYAWIGTRFAFSSEIDPLVLFFDARGAIDKEAMTEYLTLGYINAPRTIYEQIKKLPPGQYLSIDPLSYRNQVAPVSYWDVREKAAMTPQDITREDTALEAMDALLRDVMKKYVRSDVPLGLFLSGGIDSTLLAMYVAGLKGSPPKAYTISFDDRRYDETSYACQVAARYHFGHTLMPCSLGEGAAAIESAMLFGEPFADSSCYPASILSRGTAAERKVAFSGDGADELFGGYRRYFRERWSRSWGAFPRRALRGVLSFLPAWSVAQNTEIFAASTYPENYFDAIAFLSQRQARMILSKQAYDCYRAFRDRIVRDYLRPSRDISIRRMFQIFDLQWYLPGDLLTKTDRCSMRAGLEVRVPLLDHRIVELSFRFRDRLLFGRHSGKNILKQLLRAHFPSRFVDRRKKGFSVPLKQWFLQKSMRTAYTKNIAYLKDDLHEAGVTNIMKWHVKRGRDFGPLLWNILVLGEWKKRYERSHG